MASFPTEIMNTRAETATGQSGFRLPTTAHQRPSPPHPHVPPPMGRHPSEAYPRGLMQSLPMQNRIGCHRVAASTHQILLMLLRCMYDGIPRPTHRSCIKRPNQPCLVPRFPVHNWFHSLRCLPQRSHHLLLIQLHCVHNAIPHTKCR